MKNILLYLILTSLSLSQSLASNVDHEDGFDDLRKAVEGTSFQKKFVKIITLYEEANSSADDKEEKFKNLASELDRFIFSLDYDADSTEIKYQAGLFALKNDHLKTFKKYAKTPYGAHWLESIEPEKICEINNPGSALFERGKLYVQRSTKEIGKYEDRNDFTLYSTLTAAQWFDKFILSVKDNSSTHILGPFSHNSCDLTQSVGHYFSRAADNHNHADSQLILGLMHWHGVDLPETFDLSIIIPYQRPHNEIALQYLKQSAENGNEEAKAQLDQLFPVNTNFQAMSG